MTTCREAYKRAQESAMNLLARREEIMEVARPHFATLDLLVDITPGARMMWLDEWDHPRLCLSVPVDDMEKFTPILEAIEKRIGIEFDNTSDYASEWSAFRSFKSKAVPWLRVDAEVKAEGAACRPVVVGYDTVPKYEIHCGEEPTPEIEAAA